MSEDLTKSERSDKPVKWDWSGFRAVFRADRACALLGAVGLAVAAGLAVRHAAAAADPFPVPDAKTSADRPAEPRDAQAVMNWEQHRARLRAEAVTLNETARTARLAETVQGCATAAGVGLVFVGLGLILSGRRIDEREQNSLLDVVKRRDESYERIRLAKESGRGGTGSGGDQRTEPVPGAGWPDRLVRHVPGVLALVCGAALVGYAGTEPRPSAPTTPQFPAYTPFQPMAVQAPFGAPS